MTAEADRNPFEQLRLDPATAGEEIVAQAGLLRQRATSEDEVSTIRQAVQALTRSEQERALYGLLTHPRPSYNWPGIYQLVARFRRPPASIALVPSCPPLDLGEMADLISCIAIKLWQVRSSPFASTGTDDTPEEIERQALEIIWQSLLCDPRA